MNVLTSDWEVTTFSNGSFADPRNKVVCLGYKYNAESANCSFGPDFVANMDNFLLVFFNAKFDLHWYRKTKSGPFSSSSSNRNNIWCCQLGEFILEGMQNRYPSLEETAIKYGLGHKIDIIKTEYWDRGINTDEVPQEILSAYCIQDVNLTYQIYLKQLEQFKQNIPLYRLFQIQCQDLVLLEEMEWNGLVYDEKLCAERSKVIEQEISDITKVLAAVYPDININFGSGDQLSAWLYGGNIPYVVTEQIGFYKNGKPKFKQVEYQHVLPRLVEPLPGSALKKEGYFKTDEDTLRKLRGAAAKRYVEPLLRLSKLDKLRSTYYNGLPQKNLECHWPKGMIYGNFNQCVAGTGRLSSSGPNLQNFAEECQDIFISRYDN